MNTCLKVVTVLCVTIVFAFGQAADTSRQAKQDTIITLSSPSHQHIASVTPQKKTNWSKIKDLFL